MEDAEFLALHPPFAAMDPAEVERLARRSQREEAVAGSVILSTAGPPADAFFVVLEGEIEFRRGDEVFDVLGPGEVFGFPSLLSGNHPMFDVVARVDVEFLRIPPEASEEVFESSAGLRFLAMGLRERAELLSTDHDEVTGLMGAIGRAHTREELAELGSGLPEAVRGLREAGLRAGAISRAIASVVDAITARNLHLIIGELGEPGVPWAWLAFGSIARGEPAMTPDQDHTIVWEGSSDQDPSFEEIANRMVDALTAAGIPPCPSMVLATTSGWRSPVDRWVTHLLTPDDSPAREAFRTTIAIDARKVAGSLDVTPWLRRLREGVRRDPRLLWRVSRLAVERRPPIGHLGGMTTHRTDDGRRVVDVKTGGLLPVTDLARLLDVRGRGLAVNTRDRLHGATRTGQLPKEFSQALEAAFETFQEVRIDHQLRSLSERRGPDDAVEPSALESVTRSRLRQAFRIVAQIQEGFRAELGGGRLA